MIMQTLLAVAATAGLVSAACSNPRIRMEWHDMSPDQKAAYVRATVALASRPVSGQYDDPTRMAWHDFVQTHSRNAYWAHGNAQFYPYHRAMMWQFENALISTGEWPSSMGVPYFDWSAMSQNWWTSDIFSDQYFGSATSKDKDGCVLTGAFAKGKYKVADDPEGSRGITTGDLTCLRRNARSGAVLPDATEITRGLAPNTYTEFTGYNLDNGNYHASGHVTIGGDGGDLSNPSISPNDPLFYLHHGFVDKYWWRWQQQCQAFKYDYEGRLKSADDPMSHGSDQASKDLYVNSYPFIVADLLESEGDTLCYRYSQSKGDVTPQAVSCPAFTTTSAVPKPTTSRDPSDTNTDRPTETSGRTSVPVRPTVAANSLDDNWLNVALVRMIEKKKVVWKVGGASDDGQVSIQDIPTAGGDIVVFGRDELESFSDAETTTDAEAATETEFASRTGTATGTLTATATATAVATEPAAKPNHLYVETRNADNSTTISYTNFHKTIEVPAEYEIVAVYLSSVTAQLPGGPLKRFFPAMPVIEYVPNPEAPQEVVAGSHPCHLAYPDPITCEYAEAMNMSCDMVTSKHALLKMRIDEFNAANCQNGTSPSSLVNHGWSAM